MSRIIAYAKLIRLPAMIALAMPPVFGALSVGVIDLYPLFLLGLIGAFSMIWGFVINDYSDVEIDGLVEELKKKPLVSGEIPKKSALLISIFFILFTFFTIILLYKNRVIDEFKFVAVLSITLAYIFGSIYNLYGKKIIGSDFFVALSVSLLFLFGALSFGGPNIITWIIFILVFNQTLHMNAVEGGIKDADHDYKMGVNNIALKSGIKLKNDDILIPAHFKLFGIGIRISSAILLFVPFFILGYNYYISQIIILAILTFLMLYLSLKLITIKKFDRSFIQKCIGLQSFLRYSLVPIMLISIVNIWWYPLLLIIIPLIWYIIFISILGEKMFKPRM